jgi:integrase
LCGYAVKSGLLDRNPVRDLDRDDRPGVARQTEPRYLTRYEVERLLHKLSDTFRPVAATCAYAGLRVSEALGLRWRDVDFTAATLTITGQLGANGERVATKTESSAAPVTLLPALARELRECRSRQATRNLRLVHADALVFTTSRGKPQSRRNALRAVYVAGDAVGLNAEGREPVGLHDLRHSFVGLALDAGLSLPEVAELARHANARVTALLYAGLTEQGRERAAAKLLDAGFGA